MKQNKNSSKWYKEKKWVKIREVRKKEILMKRRKKIKKLKVTTYIFSKVLKDV